jgi:hypothetical protein
MVRSLRGAPRDAAENAFLSAQRSTGRASAHDVGGRWFRKHSTPRVRLLLAASAGEAFDAFQRSCELELLP